ncbi:MAG: bifunctional riboflavin kinase/FAD synthetase [Pseudomonadota bacterium]
MSLNEGRFRINDLMRADDEVLAASRGGIVAIGNFDGVHLGHQVVLRTATTLAIQNATALPTIAMTFEPHPRTVFKPDAPVFRLTPVDVKARLSHALGLTGLVVVPFDRAFSQMSAAAFVEDILIGRLGASHVVVGYDFHFGKGREGSPEFLMAMGKERGFGVSIVPAQRTDKGDLVFSSSTTREYLTKGNVKAANDILGYRYFVSGEVIHGEKRGRDLGYPTANMALAPDSQLKHGIYAVEMQVDGVVHQGVASFGRRPTFDNGAPLLETFLFGFSGDLYGKTVEVIFTKFLRGEEKFDGLDALIAQMDIDSENAKAALAAAPPLSEIDRALRTSC